MAGLLQWLALLEAAVLHWWWLGYFSGCAALVAAVAGLLHWLGCFADLVASMARLHWWLGCFNVAQLLQWLGFVAPVARLH